MVRVQMARVIGVFEIEKFKLYAGEG
jgi:hypothetical protein